MMGNYGAEGQALNLQWIEFYNDSGEEIPAFGVMRISGMRKKDGRPVIECKKPHTFGSQGQHRINGPVPVESSQYGVCLVGNHVAALYDTADGTPAFGESWGPRDATWTLKKNTGGYRVLGNADTTNGVVVVVSVPMMGFFGKTDAAHAKGANGTVSIFWGSDAGTDTTENMTSVYNLFASVSSAKNVRCEWQGDMDGKQFALTAGEC
jgi:hypothetical protein